MAEYFRVELLSRLPAAEAEFLMRTSVLDRMSGPLCDAVLQTTRSADTLETLARTNGFVVPLDRRGEWYRYHHLFGELLRDELERSRPDVVRALNRRAMEWCIANELPEAAVVYGHRAGELDTVAGLVDALALPLYYDGRMATVEEWLAWFGDDELVRYPALAVFGAWFRALTGRPADAERWLALADGATSAIPLSDGSATIEPRVAALRAHMMPDGVERALADADAALDQLSAESVWRSTAHVARGVAHALLGATDRATGDLAQPSRRGWPRAPRKRSTAAGRCSRCSQPSGDRGLRHAHARRRHKGPSRRRGSAPTGRARWPMSRRRVSRFTMQDRTRRARRWHERTVCARCSTTAFPG